MNNPRNPSIYYFKTWETEFPGRFHWEGTTHKGDKLVAHDWGETEEELITKQDNYVQYLEGIH